MDYDGSNGAWGSTPGEKSPARNASLVLSWTTIEEVLTDLTPHPALKLLMPELVSAFQERAQFLPPGQMLKELIGTIVAIRYDGFDPSAPTKPN